MEDRKKRRLESQPLEYPSAGSVFRNPPDVPAGKLIDDLHLKGLQKEMPQYPQNTPISSSIWVLPKRATSEI